MKLINRNFPWELLAAGIAAIFVFVSVGYLFIRKEEGAELVEIVAAARDIEAPRILVLDDVKTIKLPRANVPKTALTKKEETQGLGLAHNVSENEILTLNQLIKGHDPNSEANLIPLNTVAFVLPSSWLQGPAPRLKVKDRIKILAAVPAAAGEKSGTGIVVDSTQILGVNTDGDGVPIKFLLGLTLSEAATLFQTHINNMGLLVVAESNNE